MSSVEKAPADYVIYLLRAIFAEQNMSRFLKARLIINSGFELDFL